MGETADNISDLKKYQNSVLGKISRKNVFNVHISSDGRKMILTEGCDDYFSVKLSKKETEKFIQELIQVKEKMK